MTKTLKSIFAVLGICAVLYTLIPRTNQPVLARSHDIKGVWAATVFSLDYPKTPSRDPKLLKSQADELIDNVSKLGYNTLYFQVRPSSDAFYKSEIYPWSKYLTGTQGLAPENGFDPLEYLIAAAHRKNISFHAWINPFRITATEKDNSQLFENSIASLYPHLTVKHTDGKLYLNPGEPEAVELVTKGIRELAENYNIDGIHIDDYFYPATDFPDQETFEKYGVSFTDIGDWRRNNITNLIKKIRSVIKSINEDLIFSVSPCGIWANKSSHPDGSPTQGKQSYFDYFADSRLWAKDNLVDVIIPQVYWNIGYSVADFEKLCQWWSDTVKGSKTKLVIGQAVYRASDETSEDSPWYKDSGIKELENQFRLLSGNKYISGYAHYRIESAMKSQELKSCIARLNSSSAAAFSDTADYPWAEDAIHRLYEKGVVSGMGDGTFGCERQITRADFTVMLIRQTKQKVPFLENFSDVPKDKYYYEAVGIAKVLGYASGREDNIFDPAGSITREDMATLVYRVLLKNGKIRETDTTVLNESFSDGFSISEYARPAIAAMVENGWLSGYETGEFKPRGFATRAETAVFFDRLWDVLN